MKKIIITGATGLIGEKLAKELHDSGYAIYVFTRNISKSKKVLPYAEGHFNWDEGNEWKAAIENSYAVINLAGAPIAGKRWSDDYKKEIYNSRIDGTKALAEAINQAEKKPEVFISASAIGYYGDKDNQIITENTEKGNDFLADVCSDWEKESQKAEGVRVVNPRIGIVLSKEGGALKEMLTPFKFNVGGPLAGGNQWWAWIHEDDLINMFKFCLENKNISDAVNFTSPKPVTNKYFSKALGKAMGKPSFMPVPKFALKIFLGESADFVLSSIRALPSKATNEGFEFKFIEPENALKDLL
jgi:uncharacterized protein (TIGR01777 family)